MRYLVLVVMPACFLFCKGQDTLVLKHDSIVLIKVIQINEFNLKYKRWSDLNGPDNSIGLGRVVLIKYQNGERFAGNAMDNEFYPGQGTSGQTQNSSAAHDNITDPSRANEQGISLRYIPANSDIPDTIILTNHTKLLAKIVLLSDRSITYKKWDNPDGPDYSVPVSRIYGLHVPGQDGPGDSYHITETRKQNTFKQLGDRWLAGGVTGVTLGPTCILTGLILVGIAQSVPSYYNTIQQSRSPNYTQFDREQKSGISLIGIGIGTLITGGACLSVSKQYRHKFMLIKKGIYSMSYPLPDFMLPTAQNNYTKGFGFKTGIRF